MKRKQKTLLSCEGIVCPFQQQPLQGPDDTKKEKNKPSGAKLDPMKNVANKTTIKTTGIYCAGCAVMIFQGNKV